MNALFKSGFCAIVGRPNVGKSTLLNRLLGEKLAIVSGKPQTTRNQIQGVLTGENYQIIFIDTPGLHEPVSELGSRMVKAAEAALAEVDVVLFMAEAYARHAEADRVLIAKLSKVRAPVLLAFNKTDKHPKSGLLEVIERYKNFHDFAEIVPISALNGDNVDNLLRLIINHLQEGPKYFPDDHLTDLTERFLIAEIIREKALMFLQDEIPHGVAVEITKVKRKNDVLDVDATIYCEKDSHKGIIIGKQGAMLKRIGQTSRAEIETLLGGQIFLQTWVKVKKNWRDDNFLLRQLGYGG